MTRGTVVTRSVSTVVDVDAAVEVRPSVDADAVESSPAIDARSTVLTRVRHRTFVDVLRTVLTCNDPTHLTSLSV